MVRRATLWVVIAGPVTDLQEAFEAAFATPYRSHRWRSIKARRYWFELESRQDLLAGPLSSIAMNGGCAYVYTRDDEFFSGVKTPAALRDRLFEWHARLSQDVEKFSPTTPSQAEDLVYMRALLVAMIALIERACAVEQARWEAQERGR